MDEKQSYPKDIHAMDKKMSEVNFFFTHTGPDTTTGFIALKTRAALNITSLFNQQTVCHFLLPLPRFDAETGCGDSTSMLSSSVPFANDRALLLQFKIESKWIFEVHICIETF